MIYGVCLGVKDLFVHSTKENSLTSTTLWRGHFLSVIPDKVQCVRRQPDENIWVLNETVKVVENSTQLPNSESCFAWTPIGGPCIELIHEKNASAAIDL